MMQPVDFERRVHSLENRASKLWNEIQRTWPRVNQYPEDQGIWYGGYPYGGDDFPTTTTSTTTTTTTTTTTSTTTTTTTPAPLPCYCSSAYQYYCADLDLTLTYDHSDGSICYWKGTGATSGIAHTLRIFSADGSADLKEDGGGFVYTASSTMNCTGSTSFVRSGIGGFTVTVTKV